MITQANRILAIETPLAFDTLLIDAIRGTEAISRPFRYEVDLVADIDAGMDKLVDPEKLIGNEVTVAVQISGDEHHRYIHGIVKSLVEGGTHARFREYRAEVVPWFDLLKMSSTCRFFQDKSVPEIIEQVFKDLGFRAYKLDLRSSYKSIDYCAQYRETDFDFVSRLMEQEGIFYYFDHTDEAHTMVLTDSKSAYVELPFAPKARYTRYGGVEEDEDIVMSWEKRQELQTSKWKMRDFHFELQPKTLEVERPSITQRESAAHLTMYDYPGGYAKKFNKTSERLGDVLPEGDEKINRIRMESDEAHIKVIQGESDIRAIAAGYKIEIESPDAPDVAGDYLIRDCTIEAVQEPSYVSEEPRERFYVNSFHMIPADTTFRPPQTTPKPLVAGPQSAWVVDESNADPPREEIWPDKFGRIRVRFQWDLEAKYACWLRVAQPWAGRAWGHQWLPRTGDEVLVDFIDGDPDCPIVIGSLYSPKNMPPFKLPDNKTQSGIVTRTSPKGTTHQFNMLRFEDKAKGEQVMIRSQRRADVRAYGSFYETNHANRHIVVGWENPTEDDSGGNFNITVGGELNVHIKKHVYEKFDDKLDYSVHGDAIHEYQANDTTLVTNTYGLNAKQIILEASQKISLKVGGSCIVIEPSSITIAAAQVKINSGGYGTEVPDPGIDDPTDATLSDNGEPGYLDRIGRGGGGGGGHHHRQLHAQHYVYPPRPGEDPRITAARNLLQNTPTGRHALEVIDRNNVNVVMGTGGGRYDSTTNTITLDQGRTDPAGSLVHEAGHADADHDHRSADVHNQSRDDYIATQDREDAHNERLAYEAEQQMAANGTPQTYNSSTGARFRASRDAAAADYRRTHPDATDAEVNQFANDKAENDLFNDYQAGRVTTGTNGQTYPNYWGDDWDHRHNSPP